jgi:hypothetical protein
LGDKKGELISETAPVLSNLITKTKPTQPPSSRTYHRKIHDQENESRNWKDLYTNFNGLKFLIRNAENIYIITTLPWENG